MRLRSQQVQKPGFQGFTSPQHQEARLTARNPDCPYLRSGSIVSKGALSMKGKSWENNVPLASCTDLRTCQAMLNLRAVQASVSPLLSARLRALLLGLRHSAVRSGTGSRSRTAQLVMVCLFHASAHPLRIPAATSRNSTLKTQRQQHLSKIQCTVHARMCCSSGAWNCIC